MASIEFKFTHPQASYSRKFNIPNEHLIRLVDALRTHYIVKLGTSASDWSNEQLLEQYTADMMSGIKELVRGVERSAAMATAEDTVSEIEAT